MIDDATSQLWGRFVESDSTAENLRTLRGWLECYGRPVALYTDKNTIFQTPRTAEQIERWGPAPPTHFAAALDELRVEWIAAKSPQAKGRVERVFETLQDRLVKEMRIAGICTAQPADGFFRESFIPLWRKRFCKPPRSQHDAHRALGSLDLDSVLCHRHDRLVTSDYTIALDGRRWAVARQHVQPGLRKARVVVEQRLDGSCWIRYRNHRLPLRPLPLPAPLPARPCGLRPPDLAAEPKPPSPRSKPAPDHPWRTPTSRTVLLGER